MSKVFRSKIMTGSVWHTRLKPAHHQFRYPVYFYIFNLDELSEIQEEIKLFGYNRKRVISIWDKDYLVNECGSLKERALSICKKHAPDLVIGKIELLTAARFLNYIFNPVSFFFCYDQNETISIIIVEINNTFGEAHIYLLDTPSLKGKSLQFTRTKDFHVSPFNAIEGDYHFEFILDDSSTKIVINVSKNQEIFFRSGIEGSGHSISRNRILKTIIQYPMTASLTMPRILYNAAILYYRKGLKVFTKPDPASVLTIKRKMPNLLITFWVRILSQYLNRIKVGQLVVTLPNHAVLRFGDPQANNPVHVKVNHWRFFRRCLLGGDIGLGESYVEGDWSSDHLTDIVKLFIRNFDEVQDDRMISAWLIKKWNRLLHILRKNHIEGSKRNIRAHYDLGNKLFQSFLDPSMTYSCAYYLQKSDNLEDAQSNKRKLIISKSQILPEHHVLEIGCGWGSLAIDMARETGCRVTGITLSQEQYDYATTAVKNANLEDRISIQLCDYRKMKGSFDRIVSIEMLEAVGHENLGCFFENCQRLLKQNGIALIQVITMDDRRYDVYRKSTDWIQKYIFPGAVVPSLAAISESLKSHSRLNIEDIENIGPHYAPTLATWRSQLNSGRSNLEALGFDETTWRLWEYYFCYCEAAFQTRFLSVLQIVLTQDRNSELKEIRTETVDFSKSKNNHYFEHITK